LAKTESPTAARGAFLCLVAGDPLSPLSEGPVAEGRWWQGEGRKGGADPMRLSVLTAALSAVPRAFSGGDLDEIEAWLRAHDLPLAPSVERSARDALLRLLQEERERGVQGGASLMQPFGSGGGGERAPLSGHWSLAART
jgi:hypothetical protein